MTGLSRDRPGLREALAACRAGAPWWSPRRRVTVNLGGTVYDPADPADPSGHLRARVFALVANFETDLARARVRAGMAKAKTAHVVEQYRAREHSTVELADLFNVARSTIYRALDRYRARQIAAAEDPSGAGG